LLEFGLGILDGAAVYTAGTILRKGKREENEATLFIRLTDPPTEEKEKLFSQALSSIWKKEKHPDVFKASLEDLAQIPGMPYAYWASPSLRTLFTKYPSLDRDVAKRPDQPKIADVKVGLQTSDDVRFTRRWWEVNPYLFASSRQETFQGKKWVPFAKGEEYARYYADISLVVNWEREGEEIKNFRDAKGKLLSRPQNEFFYFREGLTWQMLNAILKPRMRYQPVGSIFSAVSSSIFLDTDTNLWAILSLLNSLFGESFLRLLASEHRKWEVSHYASFPVYRKINDEPLLYYFSRQAYDLLREWDTGNEISTIFIKPWLAQVAFGQSLNEKPETGHPFTKQFNWGEKNPGKYRDAT